MSNFGTLSVKQIGLNVDNPSYNGKNITNHVLYQEISGLKKKKQVFYIPSYVWIQVLNFTNLAHENLEGQINMVINVAINTYGIDETIQDKIKGKIILMFNRIDAINLGDEDELEVTQTQINKDQCITQYAVKKLIKAGMIGDIKLTPFEMIYLIVSIRIQHIIISLKDILEEQKLKEKEKKQKTKYDQSMVLIPLDKQEVDLQNNISKIEEMMKQFDSVEVYFNMMDIDGEKNHFSKITYNDQGTFGVYDLAEKYLKTEYTNNDVAERIRDKNKFAKRAHKDNFLQRDQSEINAYSFAHFQIPLYKFPCIGLFTIFVPLWLLGIIGLGVFFQDTGLADRIGSLAALMIAFIALIPVIREQLPENPDITLVQILVYLQTLTIIFCLIESLIVRDSQTYVFNWQQNGWFLASLIIMLFQFFIISMLSAFFSMRKIYYYNKHKDEEDKAIFTSESYLDWENIDCDRHFRRKIDSRQIEVYELRKSRKLLDEASNIKELSSRSIVQQIDKESQKEDSFDYLKDDFRDSRSKLNR